MHKFSVCAASCYIVAHLWQKRAFMLQPPRFLHVLFYEAAVNSMNYALCITVIFVMHINAKLIKGDSMVEEASVQKWTSIRVRRETADMLKELGRKGETYDDIIRRLIDRVRRRRKRSS